MQYRPSYGQLFRPSGSVFGAIPLASFGAAVVGTSLTLILILSVEIGRSIERGIFWEVASDIVNRNLTEAVFGLPLGIFFGTIFVALYLLVFGAPVALLFRSRLHGLEGIGLSIGTALLSSLIAFAAIFGSVGRLASMGWQAPAILLAYAIPAGILYRRSVIMLLEEPD